VLVLHCLHTIKNTSVEICYLPDLRTIMIYLIVNFI